MVSKSIRRRRPASRVYVDIKQTRPFDRAERELAVTLLRTSDVLHHSLERALAPCGISQQQYNALRILRGAGKAGHPTLEISKRLISRSPNITRLLDKLVDKGLARRARGVEDRRQALVAITPSGLKLLEACDGAVDGVLDKLGCMSRPEKRKLVELLDRLRDAVAVKTVFEEILGRSEIETSKT